MVHSLKNASWAGGTLGSRKVSSERLIAAKWKANDFAPSLLLLSNGSSEHVSSAKKMTVGSQSRMDEPTAR